MLRTIREAIEAECPLKWPAKKQPRETCIGDRCMMWRWEQVIDLEKIRNDPRIGVTPQPMMNGTRGYCGLAGKPCGLPGCS